MPRQSVEQLFLSLILQANANFVFAGSEFVKGKHDILCENDSAQRIHESALNSIIEFLFLAN